MTKKEAKKNIQKLVYKYQKIADEGKIRSYNEAQTRKDFIDPLFEYLGWDMRNIENLDEVTTEERVTGGRVDLAFKLGNIYVFFLEAKAMKVDLDKWQWAEQAISYSWNKGVSWAVLTDFEGIKILNSEMPPKNISQNLFIDLKCQEYNDRFDQLWLLSKEGFEQKLLEKEAQKWGKLTKRKQVGEKLFEDFKDWRDLLTKDFKKQNDLTDEELDEGVQRILDRLIFIRTAEDRDIVNRVLESITRGGKNGYYKQLVKIFRNFDIEFDSKLFTPHYSEEWKLDDMTVEAVLKGLYETTDGYRYDFSVISADVLGGIYEQYLSFVQGRKQEEAKKSKRKSQGIYYTPKYIVEFIVKETLGEVLKKTKPKKIKDIKVLDPACGSGSFLIAAYDKILKTLTKQNPQTSLFTKFNILKENIFGVDLDAQAVEIAQLNLLLKVLTQRTPLPTLQHNIRVGNSLVSGNNEELEKYFGKKLREQKPFNFAEEYKKVFEQGGFDVIIGNPPYVGVKKQDIKFRDYVSREYKFSQGADLYVVFIEKSLKLLKDGGYLGFICPNKFFGADYGKKIRNYLQNSNIEILKIWDLKDEKVFADAAISTVVIIIRKIKKGDKKIKTEIIKNKKSFQLESLYDEMGRIQTDQDIEAKEILDKINKNRKLYQLANVRTGIMGFEYWKMNKIITDGEVKNSIRIYTNGNIRRYLDVWGIEEINLYKKKYLKPYIKKDGDYLNKNTIDFFLKKPKLIIRGVAKRLSVIVDKKGAGLLVAVHGIIPNKELNIYFLCGLINSTLLNWFHLKTFYSIRIPQGSLKYPINFLKNIPIPNARQEEQENIAKKVQKLLELHKELQATSENTDKHNSLKLEIEKLDRDIDEAIYKLYGLTEKEIKTIEG